MRKFMTEDIGHFLAIGTFLQTDGDEFRLVAEKPDHSLDTNNRFLILTFQPKLIKANIRLNKDKRRQGVRLVERWNDFP